MEKNIHETVLNEIMEAETKLNDAPEEIRDALSWMRSSPIMHTCTHIVRSGNTVREYFDSLPSKEIPTVWHRHKARVKKISEGIFLVQHPLMINAFDLNNDCVSVVSREGLNSHIQFEIKQVASILQEATSKAEKMANFLAILLATENA